MSPSHSLHGLSLSCFFNVHVSLAYIATLITIAFIMFILVPVLILLLLQIFRNCSVALVALAILLWISLLPSFSYVSRLPKFTNSVVFSICLSFSTSCSSSVSFLPFIIVFVLLI